jgi:hypothetical protein
MSATSQNVPPATPATEDAGPEPRCMRIALLHWLKARRAKHPTPRQQALARLWEELAAELVMVDPSDLFDPVFYEARAELDEVTLDAEGHGWVVLSCRQRVGIPLCEVPVGARAAKVLARLKARLVRALGAETARTGGRPAPGAVLEDDPPGNPSEDPSAHGSSDGTRPTDPAGPPGEEVSRG